MRHVVAIADPRDAQAIEAGGAVLEHGHQIREQLARVKLVGERVDDRDVRGGGQRLQPLVTERADHDRMQIARKDARRVVERFVAADLQVATGETEWIAAELDDRDLERDARARRGLLHQERDALARERPRMFGRAAHALERARTIEQGSELDWCEVEQAQEVAWHDVTPSPARALARAPARRWPRLRRSPRASRTTAG